MSQSAPSQQRLLVIGNGMAGMRLVENVLDRDKNRFAITVVGAEPRVNYNRIMLSPVLGGEKTFDDIIIHSRQWYRDNDIDLHAGDAIVSVDRLYKTAVSENGVRFEYDKLLIATGSSPFIIPVAGKDLPGVVTFRDLDDVETMLDAAKHKSKAVVIGGGLLGLEAATGLKAQGMDVTVVHLMATLMERQLDEAAGFLLAAELESRGIKVLLKHNTKAIIGDTSVEAVEFENGDVLDADLVVMAVGIKPNVDLAQAAGLDVDRGIIVDDVLQTSDENIYSIGECIQHRGQTYGLVAPLYDMAKVLADNLCTETNASFEPAVTSTKLKVSGVDVFSAGDFTGGEDCEDIVFRDAARGIYKRLIVKDDKILGAVLYGDATDGHWYFQMIKDGRDVSAIRDTLIFGQSFDSGDGADPLAAVRALPGDAEICGCNGVCKGDITGAIKTNGLTTLDEVKAVTKASASCGGCSGLVEQLLSLELGDGFQIHDVKPVCGCTKLGHDDVRHLITAKAMKSIPEVMQQLEWSTANGCASCRPALNYYLICAWPGEYVDDYQSRFINERVHANIQKDGSFSVIPRMWGGMTSASELRAIADVVDKFEIPAVKITGGQRIDLFGVDKKDLPAVWADLGKAGMVSGHAYGKSLRTVKTCAGSTWCRFGTQNAIDLGIRLEKKTWGSWTPHKFKMAVSGCPRNCAEATIKDFGVVAVDSGFELYIGGNGGIDVRVTDFLCRVETENQVEQYATAFMQLYREEARYLERTAPWVERVGLDHIRECIVDDADQREKLSARFLHAQESLQKDPWHERARDNKDAHEFAALKVVA